MNVRGGAFYGELIVIAALSPPNNVYVPEINMVMLPECLIIPHFSI